MLRGAAKKMPAAASKAVCRHRDQVGLPLDDGVVYQVKQTRVLADDQPDARPVVPQAAGEFFEVRRRGGSDEPRGSFEELRIGP